MADALKTFREGEDILASETNDNNQFLLSKLSDNAAQVQQYVEGEVATIKSNVSSVQATLQNNLNEVAEKLNNFIANFYNYTTLDYTKGDAIGTTYTATKPGILIICFRSYDNYTRVYVNGVEVAVGTAAGLEGEAGSATPILLNKGDVITFGGKSNVISRVFYPYKSYVEVE